MNKNWLDEQLLAVMDKRCRFAKQQNKTCINLDCVANCQCHWQQRGIPKERVMFVAEEDSRQYEEALALIESINHSQQKLSSLLTVMGV